MRALPSLRHLLLTLVVGSIAPMLSLALLLVAYQAGGSRQVAILVTGTLLVTAVISWLAWRWADSISNSIEALSAAVLATGVADSLELPEAHFLEEHGLGRAFQYATTSLRDAHEATRAREARLRTILDTARDAIITADNEGRIVVFNHAAERMFGILEEDAVGRSLDTLMPPGHVGKHLAQMRAMNAYETAPRSMGPSRCVRALHANGALFPVTASISCGGEEDERLYTAILREAAESKLDLDVTAALPS